MYRYGCASLSPELTQVAPMEKKVEVVHHQEIIREMEISEIQQVEGELRNCTQEIQAGHPVPMHFKH